jgi:hypothetical protein
MIRKFKEKFVSDHGKEWGVSSNPLMHQLKILGWAELDQCGNFHVDVLCRRNNFELV